MSIQVSSIKEKMTQLKCCVLVPTYNNAKTLKRVLDGILEITEDLIIVNDGSTDSTSEILSAYPLVEQIHVAKNTGKGNALRLGFKKALSMGFEFAITIDSDGQHFPKEIPKFIETLYATPSKKLLLIGARNMENHTVPKKSSFGNKFSNFWMWVMTGLKLTDTQSGFRLYPIKAMETIALRTSKFEFEVEAIVKASWNGIEISHVPIQVLYDASERVTHYRPFIDFLRISLLNTWLVLVALFYIKPRNLIRTFRKKGFKRFLSEDILHSEDSPHKKALSMALGVFIGLSPFWGFHTVIVLFMALVLKLNKVIAFAFSNVSLPPFIPFVLYASFKVGQFVTGENQGYTMAEMAANFELIKHVKTYLIGSLVIATITAIALGILSYALLLIFNKKKSIANNG